LVFFSSLTQEVANTFPVGQGEPINTILSAASDASVLVRGEASGGLMNYLQCVKLFCRSLQLQLMLLMRSDPLVFRVNV